MSDEEPERRRVYPREHLAGVWANTADLDYSEHEFTIDFLRLDPRAPRAILVARVSCSPLFLEELIGRLTQLWQDWARKAMPPEVYPEDGEGTDQR